MEPGVYPGLDREEYERIDAANYSTLKLFLKSALHAKEEMLHPRKETTALRVGEALHVSALEPKRFEDEYAKAPKVDRRTKKGKEEWASFEVANEGKTLLSAAEWETATGMRDAVLSHPVAGPILRSKGLSEVTLVWDDPGTGISCKARIDRVVKYADWTIVADLKSCALALPDAWKSQMVKYAYHLQAHWYMRGMSQLAPMDRRFYFLCVEKDRPHGVSVFEPCLATLYEGERQCTRLLALYKDAVKSNNWPGYYEGVTTVSLPNWAFKEEEEL